MQRIDEQRRQYHLVPNDQPVSNQVLWVPRSSEIARKEQNLNQNNSNDSVLSKVKEENLLLKLALNKANKRLGDEVIYDSDSSESDDEIYDNPVNTLYYEADSDFVAKYRYITNVSLFDFSFSRACLTLCALMLMHNFSTD